MKHLARLFVFNMFGLWVVSQAIPGFRIAGDLAAYTIAAVVLSLLYLLVRPILKILFIPINIITFGLLSWLINVAILYLLTLFVSSVIVEAWVFPGATWAGFVVPSIALSYTSSLVLSGLLLSFITNTLHDIT